MKKIKFQDDAGPNSHRMQKPRLNSAFDQIKRIAQSTAIPSPRNEVPSYYHLGGKANAFKQPVQYPMGKPISNSVNGGYLVSTSTAGASNSGRRYMPFQNTIPTD